MEASAVNLDQPIPCPRCDYDLRGQTSPVCPECGEGFESLAALARASREAHSVFVAAMRWRQWIAAGILAGMGVAYGLMMLGVATRFNMRVSVAVMSMPIILASGAALALLVQVLRWRFSRRIPRAMRKRLNGSIPLLAFESIPCVFLTFVLFVAVFL